ncbi:hypothetical protein DFH09DRAFT_1326387 [Mycena vulgaris]|nr:hypothetical protein DFH09DRAFT_1326387 [Mycena vulgaris]
MPDPKQLFTKWIHRKGARGDPASNLPSTNDPAIAPEKSPNAVESVTDNLSLALSLAEQVVAIAQVAPFIAPAAALLSQILKSYKEVKAANEKRDNLYQLVSNLTGDICATILRMEATNHSDLIGRLKFIKDYGNQGKLSRVAGRNQLGDKMEKLNKELDSFGARFRNNRLVDLTINQSANAQTLEKIHDMVVQEKLEKWLRSPPDMTQKHHDTEKLRKDGTGGWFLKGHEFIEWEDNAGVLRIEGPSGAGKSVLSSAVIGKIVASKKLFKAMKIARPPPAVAFFYCDFRSEETRSVEIALRRIILQLSAQSPYPYRVLNEHYGPTLPSYKDLVEILQQLFRELSRTYIILDALDECDDDEFGQLVDLVSKLRAWTETPLHLFFTSQHRQIFTDGFKGIPCIALEYDTTQEDIRFFIGSEIQTNLKLRIWRRQEDHIKDRIARKSNGMFRLAACLLIELSRCKWEDQLDEKLENLPGTLFETYDHFLNTILPEDLDYVVATLRWIMFSAEIITLEQLAEAVAFDFSDPEQYTYKPERREHNTQAISDWLEGLTVTRTSSWGIPQLQLAHASVQDYLLSKHFTAKFDYDLSESHSHTFISRTCISFFLYFGDHPQEHAALQNSSLVEYAGIRWCYHLLCSHDRSLLFNAAMRLLEDGSEQYRALDLYVNGGAVSPLHFCCEQGYIEGIQGLLERGTDVNLPDGEYGSVLGAMSYRGKLEIIRLLLERGANVNLQGGRYGSVLGAAFFGNKVGVVRLLLESGADVNLPGGVFGSVLGMASYHGELEIIRFLLERGANVNLRGGRYGSALGAASFGGKMEIVRFLLKRGADVNLPGGEYGSALGVASYHGKREIICFLLERGADVNLRGGKYGSALGAAAASWAINTDIVRFLLNSGADINIQSDTGSCVLEAVSGSDWPRTRMVRLLLESGADVKTQGSRALQAAHKAGHTEIVALLQEKGAMLELDAENTDSESTDSENTDSENILDSE